MNATTNETCATCDAPTNTTPAPRRGNAESLRSYLRERATLRNALQIVSDMLSDEAERDEYHAERLGQTQEAIEECIRAFEHAARQSGLVNRAGNAWADTFEETTFYVERADALDVAAEVLYGDIDRHDDYTTEQTNGAQARRHEAFKLAFPNEQHGDYVPPTEEDRAAWARTEADHQTVRQWLADAAEFERDMIEYVAVEATSEKTQAHAERIAKIEAALKLVP